MEEGTETRDRHAFSNCVSKASFKVEALKGFTGGGKCIWGTSEEEIIAGLPFLQF
jgi:hypothetical protein